MRLFAGPVPHRILMALPQGSTFDLPMMKGHVDRNVPHRTRARQPERWDQVRLLERNSSVRTLMYAEGVTQREIRAKSKSWSSPIRPHCSPCPADIQRDLYPIVHLPR
jgi:hypothetical protein